MTKSRLRALLVTLGVFWALCGGADAQTAENSSSAKLKVLSLNNTSNGRQIAATVGKSIEVTLQTIGPGQYGDPQISSPAVQFEDVALKPPCLPAGPTQLYRFRASAAGEAQVKIVHTKAGPTFSVTFQVGPASSKPPNGSAPLISDA